MNDELKRSYLLMRREKRMQLLQKREVVKDYRQRDVVATKDLAWHQVPTARWRKRRRAALLALLATPTPTTQSQTSKVRGSPSPRDREDERVERERAGERAGGPYFLPGGFNTVSTEKDNFSTEKEQGTYTLTTQDERRQSIKKVMLNNMRGGLLISHDDIKQFTAVLGDQYPGIVSLLLEVKNAPSSTSEVNAPSTTSFNKKVKTSYSPKPPTCSSEVVDYLKS